MLAIIINSKSLVESQSEDYMKIKNITQQISSFLNNNENDITIFC